MNLTINDELLAAGVLAVNLRKTDIGSGVREVDLYQIMPGTILGIIFHLSYSELAIPIVGKIKIPILTSL